MNNSDEAAFAHYSGSTYVSAFNSNYNDKIYMYYINSEAKLTIENWYQVNIGPYLPSIYCTCKST